MPSNYYLAANLRAKYYYANSGHEENVLDKWPSGAQFSLILKAL